MHVTNPFKLSFPRSCRYSSSKSSFPPSVSCTVDTTFLLAVVAEPYLFLFPAAEHELVDMDRPVHRVVPPGLTDLQDLAHEQADRLFVDPEGYSNVAHGKALGRGAHRKNNEERFMDSELYLVEQCIGGSGLLM